MVERRITTEDVYRVLHDPQEQRQPSLTRIAQVLGVSIGAVKHHAAKIKNGWKPTNEGGQ